MRVIGRDRQRARVAATHQAGVDEAVARRRRRRAAGRRCRGARVEAQPHLRPPTRRSLISCRRGPKHCTGVSGFTGLGRVDADVADVSPRRRASRTSIVSPSTRASPAPLRGSLLGRRRAAALPPLVGREQQRDASTTPAAGRCHQAANAPRPSHHRSKLRRRAVSLRRPGATGCADVGEQGLLDLLDDLQRRRTTRAARRCGRRSRPSRRPP